MRCKVCGSESFRMKYGKYECNRCGARYGPDKIPKEDRAPKGPATSAPKKDVNRTNVAKSSGSSVPWKAVALVAAVAIVIGAIAVWKLM